MKKIEDILERLLAETREIPENGRVPYAFEKRIMAHIKEAPAALADAWSVWAQSLWKAVVPCLAVLVMVAVWMKAPPMAPVPPRRKAPPRLPSPILKRPVMRIWKAS